jgi:hypothetical protein
MYRYIFVYVIVICSMLFGDDSKTESKNDSQNENLDKRIHIQGDPESYDSLSPLLAPLSIDDKNLFEAVEKILTKKPKYAPDVGIGLGPPKAQLHVSNGNGRVRYIIDLYERDSGFINVTSMTRHENNISYLCELKGWYEDVQIYNSANSFIVKFIREVMKSQK